MSMQDYIKQGSGGNVMINCNNLPSKVFIDAVKTKDICKAVILTKQERTEIQPGSPDIKLIKASGESTLVSRSQLSNNYTLSNGKKIRMAFLNSGKEYVVYSVCNENYKILKLPDNCMGVLNNKRIKPGNYIVAKVDTTGNIDTQSMTSISPNLFRKMFKIPLQDVIKRNMGKGSKMFTLFNKAPLLNNKKNVNMQIEKPVAPKKVNVVKNIDTSELNINPSSIKVPTMQEQVATSKYRFIVINKLVDMNGNMVGFTVKDKSNGQIKQLTVAQVTKLCDRKLVENVMLVTKESTGMKFLKGNGMRLDNLPKVIM